MRDRRASLGDPRHVRAMQRLALLVLIACGGAEGPIRTPEQRTTDSAPAVTALQAARFEDAGTLAEQALARDPHNSRAAAVHAIATCQQAGSRYLVELTAIIAR